MSISVVYPERVQLGVKLQPHRRIKFLVDANWTNWEAWKSVEVVFDRDMPLLQMGRLMGYTGGNRKLIMENHFKNTWHLSYGLELEPFHPVTLRLGYDHRPTSVTDNSFGPVPLADMDLYSIGIGIDQRSSVPDRKIKGITDIKGIMHQMLTPDYLDLSFTYMTSEYHVNFNQSKLFNSTNFTDIIYNPFAGLTYDMKITSYIVSLKQTWLW
jgi:hypothetical protein